MRLKSWQDETNSSAGMWLLEDIPGAALARPGQGWELLMVAPDGKLTRPGGTRGVDWTRMGNRPFEVWGEGYSDHLARRLANRNPRLREVFETRTCLLEAIRLASAEQPQPTLPDCL